MHESPVLAAHREHVIDQLSSGFAVDRLEVDELEHRLVLAHAADSPAALDALVTDLSPTVALTPATSALVPAKRLRVIFGSVERFGAWIVPQHLAARVLWGNLELDLRDAQLAPGVTTIDLHVTMGNVELLVPRGVAVDLDAGALLGNVEDRTEATTAPSRLLRITGRVTLGNLEVTTLAYGETLREARRHRRWQRRFARRLH
jgi:hypothetical protein